MDLKMPTPEQAHWGLRAMKTVALADGALDDAERQMLTSVQTILGTDHAVEGLAPVTPEELASALTDRQIRHQLVQGLIVISLIDGKANARETEAVEQFARALEVNAPEVQDLRYLLKGEMLRLRLDLARRFWLREKVNEIWQEERLRGLFKFVRGMLGAMKMLGWLAVIKRWSTIPQDRWVGRIGSTAAQTVFPSPERKGGQQNKSYSMIARMSCPDMERRLTKKCRSPASAPASNGATLGRSSSLCSCNFMWASVSLPSLRRERDSSIR